MKKLFIALAAFAVALSGCSKYDDSGLTKRIEDVEKRVSTLEEAVDALESASGKTVSSVTTIATEPGGYKITFSDNTSISIMNGTDGKNGTNAGETSNPPQFKVETVDGATYLFVSYDGETWEQIPGALSNTAVLATAPKFEARTVNEVTSLWYNVTKDYPASGWVDTGFKLNTSSTGGTGGGTTPSVITFVSQTATSWTFNINGINYTFAKTGTGGGGTTTSAITRIEVIQAPTGIISGTVPTIADVATNGIVFRVNPSNATVSTDPADWLIDDVEENVTRAGAGYVENDFKVIAIVPNATREGQYTALIQSVAAGAVARKLTLVYKVGENVGISSDVISHTTGAASMSIAGGFAALTASVASDPANDTSVPSVTVTGDGTNAIAITVEYPASTRAGENWLKLYDAKTAGNEVSSIASGGSDEIFFRPDVNTGAARSADVVFTSTTYKLVVKVTQAAGSSAGKINVLDKLAPTFAAVLVETKSTNGLGIAGTPDALTVAKAAEATTLAINGSDGNLQDATSLSGIEYFPNVTSLDASFNKLTGVVDLSALESLATVNLEGNTGVTGVKLPASVTSLDLTGTGITSLDVTGLPDLATLTLDETSLTTLTTSAANTDLATINLIGNTSITSLTLNGLPELATLVLTDAENITRLDLNGNPKLATLTDLADLTKLTYLDVSKSLIGNTLTVTANTKLVTLIAENFTTTKLTTITGLGGLTALQTLNVKDNNVSSLDVSTNAALQSIDVSGNANLATFTLPTVKTALTTLKAAGAKIATLDLTGYTNFATLDIKQSAANTNLTTLKLKGTKVTALDVTNNTGLTTLDVEGLGLTAITGLPASLTSLNLKGNAFTTLNVDALTALTTLNVSGNAITKLDVSKTAVTDLNVSDNADLATLTPKNTIVKLNISGTKLAAPDLSSITTSLKELTADDIVGASNAKFAVTLTGHTNLEKLSVKNAGYTSFDASALTKLTSLDVSGNALTGLTVASANTVLATVIADGCGLTAITGLADLAAKVTSLSIKNNKFTTLTLTANTALTSLAVDGNQLTTLDVSKQASLATFTCTGNYGMANPEGKVEFTVSYKNTISDFSKFTAGGSTWTANGKEVKLVYKSVS